MSYIQKIISPNEKLIGIARLHWIYVFKGMLWFLLCVGFAYAINMTVVYGMASLSSAMNRNYLANFHGIPYLMPFMCVTGALIFMMYLLKVIGTEIGLTTSRVIRKEGVFFIKSHDVSIEEIRGDYLDLGWLGRFLGYGFINLDCRLVGDVRTPAIEKPERFLQALQQIRSQITDNLSLGGAQRTAMTMDELAQDRKVFAQDEAELNAGQAPEPAVAPAAAASVPVAEIPVAAAAPVAPIIVQLAQPPAGEAAAMNAEAVAKIVAQAVPQIVERVAEEMAAKGLAVAGTEPPQPAPDDSLIESFGKSSSVH